MRHKAKDDAEVEVEAVRWDGSTQALLDLCVLGHVGAHEIDGPMKVPSPGNPQGEARIGDWIVRDAAGDFWVYPDAQFIAEWEED